MKPLKKYLWELALILQRGPILRIKLTMRCNLKCPYCSVNMAHGRQPKFEEMGVESWLTFLADQLWNNRIKLLVISGGEPGLYKDLASIVNYAVDNGMLVQIITNLTKIEEFQKIKKSWRVIFLSTYHPVGDLDNYLNNYNTLSKKFYITVRELRPWSYQMVPEYIPWASVKAIAESQDETQMEIYAPDGSKHESCQALDRAGE